MLWSSSTVSKITWKFGLYVRQCTRIALNQLRPISLTNLLRYYKLLCRRRSNAGIYIGHRDFFPFDTTTIYFSLVWLFLVRFSTYLPNLRKTGPIVKKWQPIFGIQYGGGRHLGFWWMCIFDMTVAFYGKISTFPSNLVRIGPIVKKWQPIFEIQDGGGSHLEKYTSGWTASMRKELLVCHFQSKI